MRVAALTGKPSCPSSVRNTPVGVLLDAQVEADGVGQDEGTQRERVGADGRQDEGRHRRLEDRPAGREVVGGGARRCRDDEAVSPVARDRAAVDVHADRRDARERRLAEDGVVHDAVGPRRPPPLRDGHGRGAGAPRGAPCPRAPPRGPRRSRRDCTSSGTRGFRCRSRGSGRSAPGGGRRTGACRLRRASRGGRRRARSASGPCRPRPPAPPRTRGRARPRSRAS